MGSIIDLTSAPYSVNMELLIPINEWTGTSLVENRAVVPLINHGKDNEYKLYQVRGGIAHGYQPSKAQVSNLFPFELGFAMTLHKAQGRTLPAVILALSVRPTHVTQIRFDGIFVAISRVEMADDIRLLLYNPLDYSPLDYITQLKPPKHIQQYFSGFSLPGSNWDAEKAFEHRLRDSCIR